MCDFVCYFRILFTFDYKLTAKQPKTALKVHPNQTFY